MNINSRSMNIFLAMLGVALCVAAISMINFQREERRINQQNHSQIIASIDRLKSRVTPVWPEDTNSWFGGVDSGIDYSAEENAESQQSLKGEKNDQ